MTCLDCDDCTRCGEPGAEPRYSFGIYAGRLCAECCKSYRDHCGLDQAQGDPTTLDEFEAGGWDAIEGEGPRDDWATPCDEPEDTPCLDPPWWAFP